MAEAETATKKRRRSREFERGLSLRQAAALLGVHHSTLHSMIKLGDGPRALTFQNTHRATIRIMRADFDRWINSKAAG